MDPVMLARTTEWIRFLREEDSRTKEKWNQQQDENLIQDLPDELVIEHLWPRISMFFVALRIEEESIAIKHEAMTIIFNLRAISRKWRHVVDTTVEWNSYTEVKARFLHDSIQLRGLEDVTVLKQISTTSRSLCSLATFERGGLEWVPKLTHIQLMELVDFVDDLTLSVILYKCCKKF
jgi:hypothetical protein